MTQVATLPPKPMVTLRARAQMQSFRCMKCRTRFRRLMLVHVAIEEYVAAAKHLRCPSCYAPSSKIGMGENRTLAEDMLDRLHRSCQPRDRLAHWGRRGECGASSEALHEAAADTLSDAPRKPPQHPRDLDDFRRCILVLGHVPEARGTMPRLVLRSPHWAALVPRWAEIETLYLDESPNLDGPAPRAAKLLAEVLASVSEAPRPHRDGATD